MIWFEKLRQLTETRVACVIVTVLNVRGHAPREAGAKMLVTLEETFGTIGGGNLEIVAVERARALLESGEQSIAKFVQRLTHEESLYGVQCCGGEVEILLETVRPVRPVIAIFGVGHVGLALAKILALFEIELWLVDSRLEMLTETRLERLHLENAKILVFNEPVLDSIASSLPSAAHALVMTHDHAEDLHVVKALLNRTDTGFIGLIGSSAKWTRFQSKLLEAGIAPSQLARVTTPIGLTEVTGKRPEQIAVAVAAQLVTIINRSSTPQTRRGEVRLAPTTRE